MEIWPPPSQEEIVSAIQNLKNNKAPGTNGIHSELTKKGGPELIRRTHQLIGGIWEKEEIPMQWKTSIICPIHKKGDRLDCHDYRGISLLSTMYKIYANIIKMRLETYSGSMIGEYQAGFRRERSVTAHLFTVKQLLEKFWEYDIDLYQISVDFKQAYDSIKRETLYTAMQKMEIPNNVIRLVRSLTETRAQVRKQGQLTEEFEVKQGIKQEDGFAPLLFNIGLEYIIRKLSVSTNSILL
jgi:sorting nexin-29